MQSHLGKAQTVRNDSASRGGAAAWGISVLVCGLACEQSVLLDPVQREIEFRQTGCGERDGLPAVKDCLDQIRAEKSEVYQTPDVAPAYGFTLGQLVERSGAAGGEL